MGGLNLKLEENERLQSERARERDCSYKERGGSVEVEEFRFGIC